MLRLALVLPTTAGLRHVCEARLRARLPASQLRLNGSFTPLPQSDAADALVRGALQEAHPDFDPAAFDMALSEAIEDGRSWELAFCLAWYACQSPDMTLVADVAEAGVLVWATGAVDMDLAPQPMRYFLPEKLALSADVFQQALAQGKRVVVITPAGLESGDTAALTALARSSSPGLTVCQAQDWPAVLAALGVSKPTPTPIKPENQGQHESGLIYKRRLGLLVGGLALSVLAAGAAWWAFAGLKLQEAPHLLLSQGYIGADAGQDCASLLYSPTQALDNQLSPLVLTETPRINSQGLCRLGLENSGATDVWLDLPAGLKQLSLITSLKQETEIFLPARSEITIFLSAFPPKGQYRLRVRDKAQHAWAFVIHMD